MRQMAKNKLRDEERVLKVCHTKVLQRSLVMQVIDAEFQYDRHKLTFFFEVHTSRSHMHVKTRQRHFADDCRRIEYRSSSFITVVLEYLLLTTHVPRSSSEMNLGEDKLAILFTNLARIAGNNRWYLISFLVV